MTERAQLGPCPSPDVLSAWLDDEVSGGESDSIRRHVESCLTCREQVLGWVHAADAMRASISDTPAAQVVGEFCLDEETLTAYAEGEVRGAEMARAEQHLHECAHCFAEIQRLVQLRLAIEPEASGRETHAPVSAKAPVHAAESRGTPEWLLQLREWLQSLGQMISQPWPALGAIAVTAMLALVIARVLPSGNHAGEVQFRGGGEPVQVRVIVDGAPGRAGPADDQPIVVTLERGAVATRLEESGTWMRVQLPDGRRVWVASGNVTAVGTSASGRQR